MRLFCSISSSLSLASSDKVQNGEASSSWSYARPRTLASLLLPVSAPPPHPAALTTPPASLETRTIADGEKSPRYRSLRVLWQSSCCSVCDLWSSVPLGEVRSRSTHAAVWGWVKQGKLFWRIFPVRSVPRGRPPRSCIEKGSLGDLFIGLRSYRWTFLSLYPLQMVLKINGIFEARRGKKRMKKVSQSTESSSGRGGASDIKLTKHEVHSKDCCLFIPFISHTSTSRFQ